MLPVIHGGAYRTCWTVKSGTISSQITTRANTHPYRGKKMLLQMLCTDPPPMSARPLRALSAVADPHVHIAGVRHRRGRRSHDTATPRASSGAVFLRGLCHLNPVSTRAPGACRTGCNTDCHAAPQLDRCRRRSVACALAAHASAC